MLNENAEFLKLLMKWSVIKLEMETKEVDRDGLKCDLFFFFFFFLGQELNVDY